MGKWARPSNKWCMVSKYWKQQQLHHWSMVTRIECWGILLHICWFVITRSLAQQAKKGDVSSRLTYPFANEHSTPWKISKTSGVCVSRKVGIFKGKSPACIISFSACFRLPFDFECSLMIVSDNVLLFPNFMGFDTTARRFCWLQIYHIQNWQYNNTRPSK